MENPFVKLFREEKEPSVEKKKVIGIGHETDKGIWEWWEKYDDGSEGSHQQDRSVNISSRADVEKRFNELLKERGLSKE